MPHPCVEAFAMRNGW